MRKTRRKNDGEKQGEKMRRKIRRKNQGEKQGEE